MSEIKSKPIFLEPFVRLYCDELLAVAIAESMPDRADLARAEGKPDGDIQGVDFRDDKDFAHDLGAIVEAAYTHGLGLGFSRGLSRLETTETGEGTQ